MTGLPEVEIFGILSLTPRFLKFQKGDPAGFF
jgi:hypothetical protein